MNIRVYKDLIISTIVDIYFHIAKSVIVYKDLIISTIVDLNNERRIEHSSIRT